MAFVHAARLAGWIALRAAYRERARSTAVVVTIAVPTLLLTAGAVLVRTADPSLAEQVSRQMGAADLRVSALRTHGQPGPAPDHTEPFDVRPLLPDGARTIRDTGVVTTVPVRTLSGARFDVAVRELPYDDPVAHGILHPVRGRAPHGPGEIAASSALLRRLDLRPGDRLPLAHEDRPRVITGEVVDPADTRALLLVTVGGLPVTGDRSDHAVPDGPTGGPTDGVSEPAPGQPGTPRPTVPTVPREPAVPAAAYGEWLVSLPGGGASVTKAAAELRDRLLPLGVSVHTRYDEMHPPADDTPAAGRIGTVALVVGLAVLEAALVAGLALALGARRRRRTFGILGAVGATPGYLRAVVLAEGLTLGLLGVVVGVPLGVAAAWLARPLMEHVNGALYPRLDVDVTDLVVVAVLGLVASLAATAPTARRTARQPTVRALSGVPTAPARRPARTVALGVMLVVVGALFIARGAMRPASFTTVVVGASVLQVGCVLGCPLFVALLGRLGLAGWFGRLLPLTPRIVLREVTGHRGGGRGGQRGRATPAVAAVMAVLTCCLAVSVYRASEGERARRDYVPRLLHDQVSLSAAEEIPRPLASEAAAELPLRRLTRVAVLSFPTASGSNSQAAVSLPDTFRDGHSGNLAVAVGSAEMLPELFGVDGTAAEEALAALRRGAVVVGDRRLLSDGQVTLSRYDERGLHPLRLPAVAVQGAPAAWLPVALVGPSTARELGGVPVFDRWLIATTRKPTSEQVTAAQAVLADRTNGGSVQVERGFHGDSPAFVWILVLVSALVTVSVTTVATGLSLVDAGPDLATLTAIGAGPGLRRRFATAQAVTVAAVGSALGLAAGVGPAVLGVVVSGTLPLVLPWAAVAAAVVGGPVVVGVGTALLIRTRHVGTPR